MPRKSTTDAMFVLRMLMEKCSCDQELNCVSEDLETAYGGTERSVVLYEEAESN